ncbi:hypothetical protein ACWCP6_28330 [Streptomyces sp. NPDC002004]
MARHPQPRRITLGGREAVALTPEEYEQLIASRRQIGGQSARVRVLAHQVKRTEELLRELETLVGRPPDGCDGPRGAAADGGPSCTPGGPAGNAPHACLRCAVADLLDRHRRPVAGRNSGVEPSSSAPRG